MIQINEETITSREMFQAYPFLFGTCGDKEALLRTVEKYCDRDDFSLVIKRLSFEIFYLVNLADLVTDETWERVKPFRSGDLFAEAEYVIGIEVLKAELEHANTRVAQMVAKNSKEALTKWSKKI